MFKSHLRFRDKGSFGQCDVCFKLRKKIRQASSRETKKEATALYSKHLLSQWIDRLYYWNVRAISRQFFAQALHFSKTIAADLATSCICIIQDGMDQAKLRLPRWGYKRKSKAAEKLFRPAIHLAGTWLHGYKLMLGLSDEDQKKDSQASIELVCRCLSDLYSNTGGMALGIHLQQDNCFREGKNKYVMNFMLMLVALGVCRFSSLGYLRTSHSHEDIDQCFGQIARLLMGKACSSASELISILEDAMQSGGQASESSGRIRGSVAKVFKLDQVSVWKPFARQTGLSFKGLRHVHYFRFCQRQDMGSDVLDNVRELEEYPGQAWAPHSQDIFLITKRWLGESEVQRAVAVMPAALAEGLRTGFSPPAGIAPRRAIGENVIGNLNKRVPGLLRNGEISQDGAQYLLQWCQGTLPQAPKPTSYSILSHRWCDRMKRERHEPGRWQVPRRLKHFDLALGNADGDLGADDSSGSEGPVALPEHFDQ